MAHLSATRRSCFIIEWYVNIRRLENSKDKDSELNGLLTSCRTDSFTNNLYNSRESTFLPHCDSWQLNVCGRSVSAFHCPSCCSQFQLYLSSLRLIQLASLSWMELIGLSIRSYVFWLHKMPQGRHTSALTRPQCLLIFQYGGWKKEKTLGKRLTTSRKWV